MKKSVIGEVVFVPASKTIDAGITDFDIRNLYAIINQTAGQIIYATGTAGKGFTGISGNIITLEYDTAAMNANDVLQIIYDDSEDSEIKQALYEVAERLSFLAGVKGVLADLRVTPTGTVTIAGNITTVTTVTTVGTVSNQTSIGGFSANQQIPSSQNTAAVLSNINNIIQS